MRNAPRDAWCQRVSPEIPDFALAPLSGTNVVASASNMHPVPAWRADRDDTSRSCPLHILGAPPRFSRHQRTAPLYNWSQPLDLVKKLGLIPHGGGEMELGTGGVGVCNRQWVLWRDVRVRANTGDPRKDIH